MADLIAALQRRVGGGADSALLGDLIADATAFAKGYTGLDELPEAVGPLLVGYAAAMYQRLGCEGETAHREGDVDAAFDTENASLLRALRRYRVARAGLTREAT